MSSIQIEHSKKLKKYRLSEVEYAMIEKTLKRPPQDIEWALFSALWSEHCSYKSSKNHLKKFSYRNSQVLESEGENAGIIDLGQGERIAFKMESHNHPSFIEPFQGAATGVGGILRDIFTMGARPIALADYLCFGQQQAPRMKSIVKGVVSGISSYGNCVGVPTVTGQTEFLEGYNQNILVNAMAVGLFDNSMKIAKSQVQGVGNLVVYVGAKTGKDGIHGASMASEAFGEDSESKKPNVQIGDPFFEKLLIEACLEIIDQDLVIAMQDMGAAGLTSSSFEMSAKGGLGLSLDLSRVPLRDASMSPEEILLSESQERMLLVCEPKKLPQVQKVFSRWGLDAVEIGQVRSQAEIQLWWRGEKICEINPAEIVDHAPRFERKYELKKQDVSSAKLFANKIEEKNHLSSQFSELLTELLTEQWQNVRFSPRSWITKQYDQRVGLRTARGAEQAIAFQKLPSDRALAIAVGCRPSVMKTNARLGALDAVFYPSLQMALKGAKALAVTDCLNFGNPEKLEVMSDFVTSVEAIAEAAELMDAPVISGNVSFYNETLGQNIIPTPATGLVGLRSNVTSIPWDQFREENLAVFWIQNSRVSADLEKSVWQGQIEPKTWKEFIQWIYHGSSLWASSKAVGEGGLLRTLWKMSSDGIAFKDSMKHNLCSHKIIATPFYSAVVAVAQKQKKDFESWAKTAGNETRVEEIGSTQTGFLQIGEEKIDLSKGQQMEQSAWLKAWGF